MASIGYWKEMFCKGAAEACAVSYLSHLGIADSVTDLFQDALNELTPESLAELTGGSSKREAIARFLVDKLNLVHRCLDKLGHGFMDDEILESLRVSVTGNRKHSVALEEQLTRHSTKFVDRTDWWKMNKKALVFHCSKIRAIKSVQES